MEKHALIGCELATHMFDHPAWARTKRRFEMKEATFEQCMASDEPDPEKKYAKATALLYSPNASNAIKLYIDPLQCNHPSSGPGSHPALRGANANGKYRTSAEATERYPKALCDVFAKAILHLESTCGECETAMASPVIRGKHLAQHHARIATLQLGKCRQSGLAESGGQRGT